MGPSGVLVPFREANEALIGAVLDAATEVHREVGPGLLESAYEAALCHEFRERRIPFRRQDAVRFVYKGKDLGTGYRADLVVDDQLLLEIKCVDGFQPIHVAQLITYLRLLRIRRGFLLNFKRALMKQGIKRVSV
jgi:GxxExxY protein